MERVAEDRMTENKEAGRNPGNDGGASDIRDRSTDTEWRGRMVRVGLIFEVEKDGDGQVLFVDKDVVGDMDIKLKVNSRVAFKISLNGSKVLSLRRCDNKENTESGEAAREAEKSTKSA